MVSKELQFHLSLIDDATDQLQNFKDIADAVPNSIETAVTADVGDSQDAVSEYSDSLANIQESVDTTANFDATAAMGGITALEGAMTRLKTLGHSIFMGIGMGLGLGAFTSLTSTINQGIQRAEVLEQAELKLGKAYGWTAEQSDKYVEQLKGIAQTGAFTTSSFVEGAERLGLFGMSAEKAKTLMTGLGDALASVGGTSEQLTASTNIMAIGYERHAFTARQLMTLLRSGVPIYDIMRKEMGMTDAQIKDLSKSMSDNSDQVVVTFDKFSGALEKWGKGGMEKQAKTFSGAMAQMKNSISDMAAEFITPIMRYAVTNVFPGLTAAMRSAQPAVKQLAEDFTRIGGNIAKSVGPTIKVLVADFMKVEPVIMKVVELFSRLPGPVQLGSIAMLGLVLSIGKISSIGSGLIGNFGMITGAIRTMAGSEIVVAGATKIWAAAQWILNAALDANPIGIIVIALAALAVGLVIAYEKIKPFHDWVNNLAAALYNLLGPLKPVADLLGQVAGAMGNVGGQIGAAIGLGPTPTAGGRGGWVTNTGIRQYAAGGPVGTDTVPAMLTPGEYVLNRDQAMGLGGQPAEKGKNMLTQTLAPTAMTMFGETYRMRNAIEQFTSGKKYGDVTTALPSAVPPAAKEPPTVAGTAAQQKGGMIYGMTPGVKMAAGGIVPPEGGKGGDFFRALLTPGETVLPQPKTDKTSILTPGVAQTPMGAGPRDIINKLTQQHQETKKHSDLFKSWTGGRNQVELSDTQVTAVNLGSTTTAGGATNVSSTTASGANAVAGTMAMAANNIVSAIVNKSGGQTTALTTAAIQTNPGQAAAAAAAGGGGGGSPGGGGGGPCGTGTSGTSTGTSCNSCGQQLGSNPNCAQCQQAQAASNPSNYQVPVTTSAPTTQYSGSVMDYINSKGNAPVTTTANNPYGIPDKYVYPKNGSHYVKLKDGTEYCLECHGGLGGIPYTNLQEMGGTSVATDPVEQIWKNRQKMIDSGQLVKNKDGIYVPKSQANAGTTPGMNAAGQWTAEAFPGQKLITGAISSAFGINTTGAPETQKATWPNLKLPSESERAHGALQLYTQTHPNDKNPTMDKALAYYNSGGLSEFAGVPGAVGAWAGGLPGWAGRIPADISHLVGNMPGLQPSALHSPGIRFPNINWPSVNLGLPWPFGEGGAPGTGTGAKDTGGIGSGTRSGALLAMIDTPKKINDLAPKLKTGFDDVVKGLGGLGHTLMSGFSAVVGAQQQQAASATGWYTNPAGTIASQTRTAATSTPQTGVYSPGGPPAPTAQYGWHETSPGSATYVKTYYQQKGGVIKPRPGGTHLIAGESGEPEVITPLSKLGSIGSGIGGGHTFNISHPITIHGGADKDSIERLIKYLGSPAYREKTIASLREIIKTVFNQTWDDNMNANLVR